MLVYVVTVMMGPDVVAQKVFRQKESAWKYAESLRNSASNYYVQPLEVED
jgi:hypothetical protein